MELTTDEIIEEAKKSFLASHLLLIQLATESTHEQLSVEWFKQETARNLFKERGSILVNVYTGETVTTNNDTK